MTSIFIVTVGIFIAVIPSKKLVQAKYIRLEA